MTTQAGSHVISGPQAAQLAGITYRQLDYWARQGWLQPSLARGRGRAARRQYSRDDVIRLAALAHLGRTKADVGALAPALGQLTIPEGDVLIAAGAEAKLEVVPASGLRGYVSSGEPLRVFDPAPVRARLQALGAQGTQAEAEAVVEQPAAEEPAAEEPKATTRRSA